MSDLITSKICKKCKVEKSLEHFNKQSSVKDGYKNFCKECFKSINKDLYTKNKKRIIQNVINRRKGVEKPRKLIEIIDLPDGNSLENL